MDGRDGEQPIASVNGALFDRGSVHRTRQTCAHKSDRENGKSEHKNCEQNWVKMTE